MSNKGYPTSAGSTGRALFGPDPRGRIGRTIILIYDEMGRQTGRQGPNPRPAIDRGDWGKPSVPGVKERLPIPRIPILEALKLGWYFGEKLHDWMYAKAPRAANISCEIDCPANYLSGWNVCVFGSAGGVGCIPAVCASQLPAGLCDRPPIVGDGAIVEMNHWFGVGWVRHQWEFSAPGWTGAPLQDAWYRKPNEIPEVDPPPAPPWENPEDIPVVPRPFEYPPPPYDIIPILNRQPRPNRETGPRPRPRENVWDDPLPERWERPGEQERPRPWSRPSERPGEKIDIVPRTQPVPMPKWEDATIRIRVPRGRGQREVKVRTNSRGIRIIRGIINTVTETKDVIDALEKSLPKECRPKPTKGGGGGVTPQAKLKALYDCFDKIDFCKAVGELVENQVKDLIYGQGAQRLGKPAARRMGRPVGPSAGPIDRPIPGHNVKAQKSEAAKELEQLLKELDPGDVAADIAKAVLDEIGACN